MMTDCWETTFELTIRHTGTVGIPYFVDCKLCGTDISFTRNHPCVPAGAGGCGPSKWARRLCIPCREQRYRERAAKYLQVFMRWLAKGNW